MVWPAWTTSVTRWSASLVTVTSFRALVIASRCHSSRRRRRWLGRGVAGFDDLNVVVAEPGHAGAVLDHVGDIHAIGRVLPLQQERGSLIAQPAWSL